MARQRISEYTAKSLVHRHLPSPYAGLAQTPETSINDIIDQLDPNASYVVKVDQGVKKRFKQGLIRLDVSTEEIKDAIDELAKKGYDRFLIESYIPHEADRERYLAFQRVREGIRLLYSDQGGIEIESAEEDIRSTIYTPERHDELADALALAPTQLKALISTFDNYYCSFLEINPYLPNDDSCQLLDLAIEVDSAAEFFVNGAWTHDDFVQTRTLTPAEQAVQNLDGQSQASLKLQILNPDGSIFMLLSGGGGSIVLADEIYDQGAGEKLANYGEYSGNPSREETYLYTHSMLELLIESSAEEKILIIGGGVANFTDVRTTFQGIIDALDENKAALKKDQFRVFVRRGGPYQEEGLSLMESFLDQHGWNGQVSGPQMPLTDIVIKALKELKND